MLCFTTFRRRFGWISAKRSSSGLLPDHTDHVRLQTHYEDNRRRRLKLRHVIQSCSVCTLVVITSAAQDFEEGYWAINITGKWRNTGTSHGQTRPWGVLWSFGWKTNDWCWWCPPTQHKKVRLCSVDAWTGAWIMKGRSHLKSDVWRVLGIHKRRTRPQCRWNCPPNCLQQVWTLSTVTESKGQGVTVIIKLFCRPPATQHAASFAPFVYHSAKKRLTQGKHTNVKDLWPWRSKQKI